MIRRTVFDIVGDFETQLKWGEDIDWYTRAWESNIKKERLDFLVLNYRKHPGSLTSSMKTQSNQYRILLFKLKLERAKNRKYIPNGILIDYIGEK